MGFPLESETRITRIKSGDECEHTVSDLGLLSLSCFPIRVIRVIRGSDDLAECDPMVSGKQVLHYMPMYIGEPKAAALELERQPLMVDAKQVQDRRLQIMDMDGTGGERRLVGVDRLAVLISDVVAVVVGAAVGQTSLDAGAGQPHGEAARMMVPAVVVLGELALRVAGAAKL